MNPMNTDDALKVVVQAARAQREALRAQASLWNSTSGKALRLIAEAQTIDLAILQMEAMWPSVRLPLETGDFSR